MFSLGRRKLSHEQTRSLISSMVNAGLEHGDEAEVELTGIGVREVGTLCFCPARLRVVQVLKRGSSDERRQAMPEQVTISKEGKKILERTATGRGFIETLHATVHSNGTIHLSNLRQMKFKRAPNSMQVHLPDSYQQFVAST